jgi:hypothetical protein
MYQTAGHAATSRSKPGGETADVHPEQREGSCRRGWIRDPSLRSGGHGGGVKGESADRAPRPRRRPRSRPRAFEDEDRSAPLAENEDECIPPSHRGRYRGRGRLAPFIGQHPRHRMDSIPIPMPLREGAPPAKLSPLVSPQQTSAFRLRRASGSRVASRPLPVCGSPGLTFSPPEDAPNHRDPCAGRKPAC